MSSVKRRSTIAEIALEAGVSIPTVSKVLNQRPDVAIETRQRVERIIMERGYVRNRAARALGGGQSGLVDLVVSKSLDSEYFLEVIKGIEEILHQAGKSVVLSTLSDKIGSQDQHNIADRATDGVVLLLPHAQYDYLAKLQKHHIPFVVIDNSVPIDAHIPSVGTTNWSGGMMATQYLISLGHRRIGMITGEANYLMARARTAGYQAALEAAGISLDSVLIRQGTFHPEEGFAQANALLDLANPPTAIFAGSDWQAAGVYRAISAHGLSIPGDISVIGFDDVPSSQWMNPPLTTIRQPLKEMGRVGASMLLRLIAGEQLEATRIELATSLVLRASCAPPPGAS
jgi:LacI family transcriptional regulator